MLRKLRLHNFKCFADETLDLGALTLLSGLNGSGKSSVIQSLLLLQQSHRSGLLQQGMLLLNGDLVQLGTAQDVTNESAKVEEIGGQSREVIGLTLEHEHGVAKWQFAYDPDADVLKAIGELPNPGPGIDTLMTSLFSEQANYLCAERLGPRPHFGTSDYVVRRQRQIGPRGEYAAHFLALFGKEPLALSTLGHLNAVSDSLSAHVEAWLGEFCPDVRINLTQHPTMDLMQVGYSFAVSAEYGTTNSYRPTNVGFGLTYTLPLVLVVLAAQPGSLLLLENPEAHLHPRGQARIGELLARAAAAGVQVVLETHSDHVLNGIRVAVHRGELEHKLVRLHYFTRAGTDEGIAHRVDSPQIDRAGRIDPWPEGFFDEYERSLEALLRQPVE